MLGPQNIFFTLRPNTPNKCEIILMDQVESPQPCRQKAAPLRWSGPGKMDGQGPRRCGKATHARLWGPKSSKAGTTAPVCCGKKNRGVVPAHTYPRKKGKQVILLIVDDISRVPLVPLLGVPQPDRAGPGLPSATASQPLAAPAGKTHPHHQGHAHTCPLFSGRFSLKHLHWVRTTATNGAFPSKRCGNKAEASELRAK